MMKCETPHPRDAIILRQFPYGEADLIVTFLSLAAGKLKGFARHAKRSQKRFGAGLQPGSRVNMVWRETTGGDLVAIDDVAIDAFPKLIRFDEIAAMGVALDITDHFAQPHQASPEKFHLLRDFLDNLNGAPAPGTYLLFFLIALLRHAGFLPELHHCLNCGRIESAAWWFDCAKGGIVCAACADIGPARIELTPDQLIHFRSFLRWPPVPAPLSIPPESVFLAGRVVKMYLLSVLPHPFKSLSYLDRLWELA